MIMMICAYMLAQTGAFAMSTKEFDKGMEKGINYFDQGLYYEAKDEFTWFRDYNKHNMNSGQLKYLEDYLQGTWNRIYAWEAYVKNRVVSGEQAIELVKNEIETNKSGFVDVIPQSEIKNLIYSISTEHKFNDCYIVHVSTTTINPGGTGSYKIYKDSGYVEYLGIYISESIY